MKTFWCNECKETFDHDRGAVPACPACETPKDNSRRLPMDNISLQKRVYGSVTEPVYNEQGDFYSTGKSDFKQKIKERGLVPID